MFITMAFGVIASGPSDSSPFSRFFSFAFSYFLLCMPPAALISCAYCPTISHAHRSTEITSIFIMAASAACGVQQDLSGVGEPSARLGLRRQRSRRRRRRRRLRLRLRLCLTHARKCQQCA